MWLHMAGGRGGDRSTLAQVAGSAAIGRSPRFFVVLVQGDVHFEPKDYLEEETSARFLQAPLAPLFVVFVFVVPHVEDFRITRRGPLVGRTQRRDAGFRRPLREHRREDDDQATTPARRGAGSRRCAEAAALLARPAELRRPYEGGPRPHVSGMELRGTSMCWVLGVGGAFLNADPARQSVQSFLCYGGSGH